jgi:hypothetical protein
VTCDYTPPASFSGDDTFTYTIEDGFGGSATATVTVTVEPAVAVDLDIRKFQVSRNVKLDTGGSHPVRISLTVKNAGDASQPAQAVVTGVRNGVTVYSQAMDVSDPSGNGQTRWDFPSFTPTTMGVIDWTAIVNDGDPDDDTATATTTVR